MAKGEEDLVGCRSFGVNTVLVGLHRIGLVGLKEALERADAAGSLDQYRRIDLIIEILAGENYIPDRETPELRTAVWREYLRFKGEDFTEFFSEIAVTVRGPEDDTRDTFVDMLESVFGDFELRPVMTFDTEPVEGKSPQLIIDDDLIVGGLKSRRNFKMAVRRSITDW